MTESPRTAIPPESQIVSPNERGFTLIELLVYISLMVVVLALVGGMLISSIRAESSVRTAAQLANDAQIISRSVGHGIANASGFQVSVPSPGTQLLVARTASGAETVSWSCQGWYFDGSRMYTTRKSPTGAITAPTAGTLPTWSTIGDEIKVPDTGRIFTPSGKAVLLAFRVGADDNDSPVVIETSATRPDITPEVSAPCF